MDGGASGTPFLVNVATPTNPRREWPAIVECGAGFVIAWIEFMLGDPNGNVKLRIFDAGTFSPGDGSARGLFGTSIPIPAAGFP